MNIFRHDLIESAWDASKWQFPDSYTIDDFAADTSGWEFWPVVVDGVLADANTAIVLTASGIEIS